MSCISCKKLWSIPALEWLLILITITLGLLWTSCNEDRPLRTLPVYGMQDEQNKSNHTIAPFSFIDQNGDTVTDKDYSNKVYVTDFFFTTCRSICPVMTTQMQRVFEHYKSNPDVMFLSYSVNPEYDTPAVLKEYADKHHADAKKWHFVTGDKQKIYDLARISYLVTATKGDGGPDDFVHTQNFALIDKEKRIRGYYDGTDSTDVNKLITEIDLLLREYKYADK